MRTQDERDQQTLDIAMKVFGAGVCALLLFLLILVGSALVGR
ncbi:hypothetical protein [Nocardioides sp. SR21]|nr:hypothetical protein [Nocardioides sp. SR21]